MAHRHTHRQHPRHGSCLAHGEAHTADHHRWTRRDFLLRSALAATGFSFFHQGQPVHAFGQGSLLQQLARVDNERVLVLIQLAGGNDGLNTIIPIQNDLYYQKRPVLAVPKADAIALTDDYGVYPGMTGFEALWGEGQMAVVHSVGYDNADLSHFRSMDIWSTASDANDVVGTGWLGRYFDAAFPDFAEAAPDFPLAVQIGGGATLLFKSLEADLAMNIHTIGDLNRITQEGVLYDPDDVPETPYGSEIAYLRTIANNTIRYPEAIKAAYGVSRNHVSYGNTTFGNQLATVGRLIKGQLGAKIYLVTLDGFDSHRFQDTMHQKLIEALDAALKGLFDDLAQDGLGDDVLVMTFSEFGRRVEENASRGTDHGTAAPIMLFGTGLHAGFHGTPPNLADLDDTGNLKHHTDFRTLYATLLQHWFGLSPTTADTILGRPFDLLPLIAQPASPVATEPGVVPVAFALSQNFPNPFQSITTLSYTLHQPMPVRLDVFDLTGRQVRVLVDRLQPAGPHTVHFDATGLPSGPYPYRLTTPEGQATKQMTLLK